MAIIKCKMCGGDLEVTTGTSVAECEYCGTKQTLPKVNDEVIQNLFNRANNLRIKCEFDKAEQIYEKILQENDAEAEAHWGIVLCKYGIEYVEDPKTYKRIPTCHRTSYDAVTTDADYLAAVEHADAAQKSIYEAEARAIDEIQKNILNIVKNEKPFDVFICYKETDENGKRTIDSAIANDIYYQLTQEGMKVFYAAITLEDKLGQEYEPYIFAALNSAKVMLVIGTKPQYFSAVWVKNEWSRFLKLMKSDRSKLLIPCYRDMDAYDLPEEFAHLQAQDMSKIGFINDVVRGIKKVAVKEEPKATVVKETVIAEGNANTAPLLKRAFMFLEDGDWNSADEYCEKVLDIDPENAQAYLGKLMAELKVKKQDDLKNQAEPFDGKNNYQKVLRFADDGLKAALIGYIEHIKERNENARIEGIYNRARSSMQAAKTESAYKEAASLFASIPQYKDAETLEQECREKAEAARKNEIYNQAKDLLQSNDQVNIKHAEYLLALIPGWRDADELQAQCPELAENAHKDKLYDTCKKVFYGQVPQNEENWRAAQKGFESISGWKDADALAQQCAEQIEKLKEEQTKRERKAEADRIERERKAEADRKAAEERAKRKKKRIIITVSIVSAIIAFIIVLNTVIIPVQRRTAAIEKYGIELVTEIDNLKVGDIYSFGTYEQDNNTSNGKEAIEWIVLKKQNSKVLLISKYILDYNVYNDGDYNISTGRYGITWESCTLRKWLNNDFVNTAFTAVEQFMIPKITVAVENDSTEIKNPGKATQDQVFLLSSAEVGKYFNSEEARESCPTAYAVANGASSYGEESWWLRSLAWNNINASIIKSYTGEIDVLGVSYGCGVRPALWIDLNS